ncbi:hypothetical protein PITCH_A580029 [uncultured Desulfobacterium sp.]|uniref:Uncharacterized protein n=1 Tax=uncultured Desulfobacterium sp. TaxID=201089 RepID=A0A445N104_9BACT|nr:hypothetical protein PITCH_A580029 [uncultured Desulfobacterium sp.]
MFAIDKIPEKAIGKIAYTNERRIDGTGCDHSPYFCAP